MKRMKKLIYQIINSTGCRDGSEGRMEESGKRKSREDLIGYGESLSSTLSEMVALGRVWWKSDVIPGMREPGGLPSMGSHRVGHD